MQYIFNVSSSYAVKLTPIPFLIHRAEESNKYFQLGKLVPHLVHPFLPVYQLLHFGPLLYMLQHVEDNKVFELGSKIETL
jgi:hypothetical protein